MRARWGAIVLGIAVAGIATPAAAQNQPTLVTITAADLTTPDDASHHSQRCAIANVPVGESPTDMLARDYYAPRWDALQRDIANFLVTCHVFVSPSELAAYVKTKYVIVVFPSTSAKKSPEFLHVLVGGNGEPYRLRIPHRDPQKIKVVFLSGRDSVALRVLFQPTTVVDPTQQQLTKFLGQLPLSAILPVPFQADVTSPDQSLRLLAHTPRASRTSPPPPNLFAGAEDVVFRGGAGTISLSDDATFEAGEMTAKDFEALTKKLAEIQTSHRSIANTYDACVQQVDARIGQRLETRIKGDSGKDQPVMWTAFTKAADSLITTEAASVLARDGTAQQHCDGAADTFGQASAVIADYRRLVSTPAAVEISSTASIDNSSLRQWEFTTVAGVLVGRISKWSFDKAKVDSGKYVNDVTNRGFTAVALAWHPAAFDATRSTLTGGERWSVLMGAAITPAAGLVLGLSAKPLAGLRGLGVSGGLAAIVTPTFPKGAGANQDAGDPLRTRYQTFSFFAINYAFGN